MRQFSLKTGKTTGPGFVPICEEGGIVEMEYDLDRVELVDSPNPYVRFAGLLPIRSSHDRLPRDARYTPLIHARKLGAQLGLSSLYLKDESLLPTRSTKDRMAAVSLAYLWECGVRSFCTSSTGNSSSAYAHAIPGYPDMHLVIFTAENFIGRIQHATHPRIKHFGLRGASFVEAFSAAGAYAGRHGLVSERGFFNLGRREGLKLAFFEATEQAPGPIDWYVQAVSSAMGVFGTHKGAGELLALGRIDRLPKLLCVQQESCCPMVRAHREGCAEIQSRHIVSHPTGIAEAILRGDPSRVYPAVRGVVMGSGGGFESASEAEIREARKMLEEVEGGHCCFSAATALAGLVKKVRNRDFPTGESVLVNLTGGTREPSSQPVPVTWLQRDGETWREE